MLILKNPKDDGLISELHEASAADIDKAVDFANGAFETGEWSTYSGAQRGKCLNKFSDLLELHGDEIACFESLASGRPISMTNMDILRVANVF